MKYTFQHYIDIQTSASSLTLFQVQAGGYYTYQRIKHLFPAYKYIKLGRVSIKLLPASTLPVDPLGLSYDASDPQTIDPRDQMNPGLVRITNGEDILTNFNGLSDIAQEQMYINTMLDPRWSKFMLQSGFKRSAVPLYWTVGQLAQDPYPGSVTNLPTSGTDGNVVGTVAVSRIDNAGGVDGYGTGSPSIWNQGYSDPRGFFQTGHRGRMGWMPTDAFYRSVDRLALEEAGNVGDAEIRDPMIQPLPEVNVITVLLPKAHKTVYYYRCFITETVYLSGLKNTGINDPSTQAEYRAIDNFTYAQMPAFYAPNNGIAPGTGVGTLWRPPQPPNTGGGEE